MYTLIYTYTYIYTYICIYLSEEGALITSDNLAEEHLPNVQVYSMPDLDAQCSNSLSRTNVIMHLQFRVGQG